MACSLVLIVEDDMYIRESLKEYLEFEGYPVHVAENGKDAIEFLRSQYCSSSQIVATLVLLDLMMPVMSGKAFLKAFENEFPEIRNQIPVIVLTAASVVDTGGRQVEGVLKKPFDLQDLRQIVHKHCGSN